jgi:hypothetical protein
MIQALRLRIECRELTNMDLLSKISPFAVLFVKQEDKWIESCQTEIIPYESDPNYHPKFETPLQLDFNFTQNDTFKIVVFDCKNFKSKNLKKQNFLGEIEFRINDIIPYVGRKTFVRSLVHPSGSTERRGYILIRASTVESIADIVHIELSAINLDSKDSTLFIDNTSPFIIISRGENEIIYTSEVKQGTQNITFKPIVVPMKKLCDGDRTKRFKIECWSHKKTLQHDLIGVFDTNLETLQKNVLNATLYPLVNEKLKTNKEYKNSGSLCISSVMIEKRSSFMDYIIGGSLLHLSIAFDFSKKSESEHNKYVFQKMMLQICEIFDIYTDRKYAAYGFGAQLPNHEKSSQSFPINFDSDARVKGVEGLVRAYEKALSVVKLNEPAHFSSVISTVASHSSHNDGFHVLVIITSCMCDDLQDTLKELSRIENHQPHVVILSNSDMSRLSECKNVSCSTFERPMEALKLIPDIFVAYMRKNNIMPQQPVWSDEETH